MLRLTKTQRQQVDAVVENARHRVDNVLKIPGASGTSPYERRERFLGQVREAFRTGQWGDVKRDARSVEIRNEAIPGQGTTYGAEVARIARETHAAIAQTLTVEQQNAFADTPIEGMLVGPGIDVDSIFRHAKETAAEEE